jgi:hypothetical protein
MSPRRGWGQGGDVEATEMAALRASVGGGSVRRYGGAAVLRQE